MGGYNPGPMQRVERRIRELEKLARKYRKDQAELDKTIRLFKAELKKLKKRRK